jgi:hypothetical protein
MSTKRIMRLTALAVLAISLVTACSGPTNPNSTATTYLYAVDTYNGKVFQIDPITNYAAPSALVTTGQNSSGEIVLSQGKGFIAVGSYGNKAPGLYYFNPSAPASGCSLIGDKISAQYICIESSTVGYVTSADYGTYANALYSFNPSKPGDGLAKVVDLSYPQDVVVGSDGYVYVAENSTGKVARVNPSTKKIEAEIACTAGGTTGLLAGIYNGANGVFVANNGGYDSSWNALPGSLDFIANSGTASSAVISKVSMSRLAAFSSTMLAATNYGNTYIIDTSAKTSSEVKSGTTSFGSSDVNIYNGKAYVPTYTTAKNADGTSTMTSYVYGFDKTGAVSAKISVGDSTVGVTNIGVGESE